MLLAMVHRFSSFVFTILVHSSVHPGGQGVHTLSTPVPITHAGNGSTSSTSVAASPPAPTTTAGTISLNSSNPKQPQPEPTQPVTQPTQSTGGSQPPSPKKLPVTTQPAPTVPSSQPQQPPLQPQPTTQPQAQPQPQTQPQPAQPTAQPQPQSSLPPQQSQPPKQPSPELSDEESAEEVEPEIEDMLVDDDESAGNSEDSDAWSDSEKVLLPPINNNHPAFTATEGMKRQRLVEAQLQITYGHNSVLVTILVWKSFLFSCGLLSKLSTCGKDLDI